MRRFIVWIVAVFLALAPCSYLAAKAPASPAAATETKEIVVYITRTGECYHRGYCRYLCKSKIAITLKDAKAKGYRPCKKCKPPT